MSEDTEEYVKHRLPKKYYNMAGATTQHHYVAQLLSGNLVFVKFLRLPIQVTLPYDGYTKELPRLVEIYLVLQHDTMSQQEKDDFARSFIVTDGKIGAHDFLTPSRVEFGFVSLNVRTSIRKDGGCVSDYDDVIWGHQKAIEESKNKI